MATSASLFNMGVVELSKEENNKILKLLKGIGKEILDGFSDSMDDVATYPNPFYKWDTGADVIKDMEQITLVDGGEADENVPLEPFLQPARQVDAIIAFDNSADVNRWPNGKSLHATYEKAMNQQNMYDIPSMMPPVPSPEGFVNQGLNSRPTFFGCDNSSIPTVIYIPNYPYIYQSNADTMKLKYSKEEALGIVDNGRRALNLNGTVRNWPQCLTCALMDNAVMQEKDAARSKECQECFDRFCWDGTDDQAQPKDYIPKLGDPHPFMP
ncbi:hypothetical protein QFC19_006782 [Naganishia cerealis]|uniref:Uncharacterized protein n=1 Tax=Naganishia cerealis TaxID=610337 RepID=A0ACC2VFR6_9TREE|nr:hypothetical protein QFC19_006782 [Naganishia cerealis]